MAEHGIRLRLRGWAAIAGSLTVAVVVSACTNTQQALDISSRADTNTAAPSADAGYVPPGINPLTSEQDREIASQGSSSAAPASAAQTAAVPANVSIQLSPVIGAPANAMPPLSNRLMARAKERGIPISSESGNLSMKGYFSAIADGGETTVIYVWDVVGADGKRLHRIQGKRTEPSRRGEGWAAVTAPTMEAIADQTINELAAWLSSGQA